MHFHLGSYTSFPLLLSVPTPTTIRNSIPFTRSVTDGSIPISVSINEYVELAKMYSTPKSGKYVNATLDHISKQLLEEKKLVKTAPQTPPKESGEDVVESDVEADVE